MHVTVLQPASLYRDTDTRTCSASSPDFGMHVLIKHVGLKLRQYFAPLERKGIVMHTQVYKPHDFICKTGTGVSKIFYVQRKSCSFG